MPRAILGKNNYLSFLKERHLKLPQIPQSEFILDFFEQDCKSSGLVYSSLLLKRFIKIK